MHYAAVQQITAARHIARSARKEIVNKTGMSISLVMRPTDSGPHTPEHMLHIIAEALNMSPDNFTLKTRNRNIAELRFIGALFLRRNFPLITLQQIAALFGGQDHSSILSGLSRAYDLIYSGDPRFLEKYNTVLKSVNQWLRKEE